MDGGVQASNIAAVRRLCEGWPTMSRKDYAECLTADCVYVNVPRPEQRRIGPEQAYDALKSWRKRCRVGLEILHIVADERVVLAERFERFEGLAKDDPVVELYVMGVFEMRDGRISAWRDYFDAAQSPSKVFLPAAAKRSPPQPSKGPKPS